MAVKTHKFPLDERPKGPRVSFRSQQWNMSTEPKLKSKGDIPKGKETNNIHLYLSTNFAENYTANWVAEDLVTALVDRSGAGVAASVGATADNLLTNKAKLGGIMNAAKYATGETSFPGEFLVFHKADPMTLSFTYDLIPRNQNEAIAINDICTAFKLALLPTFRGLTLSYPDIWNITFMDIYGIEFPTTPTQYKDMALVGCNVTYGGGENSAATFADGFPVATNLALTFKSVRHSYK